MKWNIIYFSGTGNTLKISQVLTRLLMQENESVHLISLEDVLNDSRELPDADGWGFGFPVYKFTYPDIFKQIFPLLLEWKKKYQKSVVPSFVYNTYCRFSSKSLKSFSYDLQKIDFYTITSQSFKSPSNGIASLQDTDSFEYNSVMYFENNIAIKIETFKTRIIENKNCKKRKKRSHYNFLINKKISFVKKLENTRYPELDIDINKCISCGLCAKKCPEKNLSLKENKLIISDIKNCLHCLRCLHLCPRHAISFGSLVKGPNRYTSKTIERLYEKATFKEKKDKEPGTTWVKFRWALNTITYWIQNRNNT